MTLSSKAFTDSMATQFPSNWRDVLLPYNWIQAPGMDIVTLISSFIGKLVQKLREYIDHRVAQDDLSLLRDHFTLFPNAAMLETEVWRRDWHYTGLWPSQRINPFVIHRLLVSVEVTEPRRWDSVEPNEHLFLLHTLIHLKQLHNKLLLRGKDCSCN